MGRTTPWLALETTNFDEAFPNIEARHDGSANACSSVVRLISWAWLIK